MKVLERFLNYVKFDTQSKMESDTYPSTLKQLELMKFLKKEIEELNLEANIDEYGYLISRIHKNTNKKVPSMALIAHVDTSPDASGCNVNPRIIKQYDGSVIVLNEEDNILLQPTVFPSLEGNIGHDLVVTDGTTLLGADDKLGVAEIMTIAEFLVSNPDFEHGEIVIVFTPDEEVGDGTKFLDVKTVNADFGFTLDGGKVGEIAYENFNAASAKVTINGKSVHPGSAKNKMVNSIGVAYEFDAFLPVHMKPESTEEYEGFNHMVQIRGTVEKTVMDYIIRNHDRKIFESQKEYFGFVCDTINKKYGDRTCLLDINDSYFNMAEILKDHQYVLDIAIDSIKEHRLEPIIEPIRGGTDGARLTYMGLPCPNLGTGGYNYHGPFEYASIQEMNQAVEIVKTIISKIAAL
ncbi:MAG: peptidase T [Bacilli bacterium]|nr:peptidase T [Bacilli bacterium]MBN2876378.1 peptidase T [Bacilli bacterium]